MSATGTRKISHFRIGKNDFENRGDVWHHTHLTSYDDLCDAWCEVMVVLVQYSAQNSSNLQIEFLQNQPINFFNEKHTFNIKIAEKAR